MLNASRPPTPPGALDLTGDAARRRRELQRGAVAVLERGGVRGAAPADLRVRGHVPPGRRRRRRRAADPLPRSRRADPRAALRLHLQHRPHRVHHVRRRGAAAPAQLLGQGLPPGARARRPAARDASGGRRAAGRRRRSPPTWRSCGSRIELVRSAGLEDFQVNLGHVGVLAPGLAALEEPLRAAGAALDRPEGPRQPHAAPWPVASGDAATLAACRS